MGGIYFVAQNKGSSPAAPEAYGAGSPAHSQTPLSSLAAQITAELDKVEPDLENGIMPESAVLENLESLDIDLMPYSGQAPAVYARLNYCLARIYHIFLIELSIQVDSQFLDKKSQEAGAKAVLAGRLRYNEAISNTQSSKLKYSMAYLDFLGQFGDNAEFLSYMEAIKSAYPNNADVHVIAAVFYLNTGDPKKAESEIETAEKKDPQNEQLNYFLGMDAVEKEAYKKALGCFKTALQKNPNSIFTHKALANAYSQLNMQTELLAELLEVERLDPNDYEAKLHLAEQHHAAGRYTQAVLYYEEALKLAEGEVDDKTISEILSNTAVAHAALYHTTNDSSHLDRSGARLEQSLKLDPHNSTANYNYACFWSLKGDAAQADKYLRNAFSNIEREDALETKKSYNTDSDLKAYRKSPFAKKFEEEVLRHIR